MKFFIDSADTKAIEELLPTGLVDGVTTNPSLIAKSGRKIADVIKEICEMVEGPVSAEVTATDYKMMLEEAHFLGKIASNVAIKVPLTPDGLRVCKALSEEGKMVNVTLCFSPLQALLAAKAGAAFISPFVGRLDDIGENGMDLVGDICHIYDTFQYPTEVLVASVRNTTHILEAAKIGADVVTTPPKLIHELYNHPLTEKGLNQFLEDWKKTGQSILA